MKRGQDEYRVSKLSVRDLKLGLGFRVWVGPWDISYFP